MLGVYRDGFDVPLDKANGIWSAWRLPGIAPYKLWEKVRPALDAVIRKHGFIRFFVYYGDKIPVEVVAEVERVSLYAKPTRAPGVTLLPDPSRGWVRYRAAQRLAQPIAYEAFREMLLNGTTLVPSKSSLGEASRATMHHSGIAFVEDPIQD